MNKKCRCWNPARQHDDDCPVHGSLAVQRRIIDAQEGDETADHPYSEEMDLGGEG